jgi:hypothetical protein
MIQQNQKKIVIFATKVIQMKYFTCERLALGHWKAGDLINIFAVSHLLHHTVLFICSWILSRILHQKIVRGCPDNWLNSHFLVQQSRGLNNVVICNCTWHLLHFDASKIYLLSIFWGWSVKYGKMLRSYLLEQLGF